jgi:hypothetical protein
MLIAECGLKNGLLVFGPPVSCPLNHESISIQHSAILIHG